MKKRNNPSLHFPARQYCILRCLFCLLASPLFSQTNDHIKKEAPDTNAKSGAMTTDPWLHVNGSSVLFDGTIGDAPVTGGGPRLMWVPSKRAFRAGQVNGNQWDHGNIGQNSFVGGGINNSATAEASFVGGGDGNAASGNRSFVGGGVSNMALFAYTFVGGGTDNEASALSAFVGGGSGNTASGNFSFTGGGTGLLSKSYAEAVVGAYNTDYIPAAPNGFSSTDRLFVIGKGANSSNRSNAMTVLKNGRIGIGTETPDALFQVTEGAVLFEGISGMTPLSGAGTRMMWVPFKSAFRAGQVTGTHWDDTNIGLVSFVGGGWNNIASGTRAGTCGGESNTASGSNAFAGGGLSNTASGDHTLTGGGAGLLALSYSETVFGTYNSSYTPSSTTTSVTTDRLFIIGNGTSIGSRSNAVTVMKNGNTGFSRIPTTNRLEVNGTASKSSAGDWLANSDARLKKNIQPLNSQEILQKMLALQGVTYEWDDDRTGYERPGGRQYGFTAQNIREVFPHLVGEDGQGFLETAYGTYDAMMVEAVRALYSFSQELGEKIEEQQAEIENLRSQLTEMDILKQHLSDIQAGMARLEAALSIQALQTTGDLE